jgi:hypothetical protein
MRWLCDKPPPFPTRPSPLDGCEAGKAEDEMTANPSRPNHTDDTFLQLRDSMK